MFTVLKRISPKQIPLELYLAVTCVCFVLFSVFHQLHFEWVSNSNYSHGWFVPLLSAYMIIIKIKAEHPKPAPPKNRSGIAGIHALLFFSIWLLCRLIQEANPDWRLVNVIMVSALCMAAFSLLYLSGGLPWVKHFSFPILFLFLCVSWPGRLEGLVINYLTLGISFVSADILNWMGIPTFQNGITLFLPSSKLMVAESCSGIRSIQVCLMFSLFLGEFRNLHPSKRTQLLIMGLLILIISNCIRIVLTAVVIEFLKQPGFSDKIHDYGGTAVLILSFIPINLLSLRWAIYRKTEKNPLPMINLKNPRLLVPSLLIAFFLILTELFTLAWYFRNTPTTENQSAWTINWDSAKLRLDHSNFINPVRDYLKFDEGKIGFYTGQSEIDIRLFYMKWKNSFGIQDQIWGHQPETCFPSQGWKKTQGPIRISLEISNTTLPFRYYEFAKDGIRATVCRLEWQKRSKNRSQSYNPFIRRLQAVMDGQQLRGIEILEILIMKTMTPDEATELIDEIFQSITE